MGEGEQPAARSLKDKGEGEQRRSPNENEEGEGEERRSPNENNDGEGERPRVDTDEWVKSAMCDDTMVAETLMGFGMMRQPLQWRLKKPQWGLRQPRSRQISGSEIIKARREGEAARRASPTTPLSWSAGSPLSGSGGGDGCEESSRSVQVQNGVAAASGDSRSKVAANESSPSGSNIRKAKKKKTFTEFKEEENSLLLENAQLKKQLKGFQIDLEKHKENNKQLNNQLKRTKVIGQLQTERETTTMVSVVFQGATQEQFLLFPDMVTVNKLTETFSSSVTCSDPVAERVTERCPTSNMEGNASNAFMLPDLNAPLEEEEDSGSEMFHGMS